MTARKGSLESNKIEIQRTNQVLFPPVAKGDRVKRGFGQTAGLKPRFESEEELHNAIETYFEVQKEAGNHPTMAGLSLSLGFKSRKSLMDYIDREGEYAEIIEMAKTRMEDHKNQMLLKAEKSAHGIIFDLKNAHGWADRNENVTKVEAGDTLADLLQSLQGSVLRPVIEHDHDMVEEAEFTEIKPKAKKMPPPDDEIPEEAKGLF